MIKSLRDLIRLGKQKLAVTIIGTLGIMVLTVAPAQADESSAPIAGDVMIAAYPGTSFKTIDLAIMEQVSDPARRDVWICGVKPVDETDNASVWVDTTTISGIPLVSYVLMTVQLDITVETAEFRYCVTNGSDITWGRLTIDIVYPTWATVEKTLKANGTIKKGSLTVTNANDDFLTCYFGQFKNGVADSVIEVPPYSSMRASVTRHRVDWLCTIGYDHGYAGQGTIRGIELPQGTVPGGGTKRMTPMDFKTMRWWLAA